MTNPNVPRPNPDQNPGQNPYAGDPNQAPQFNVPPAAVNAQRGHEGAADPAHRPSSFAAEHQAYSAPGAPGNTTPEYAGFDQGAQNHGGSNLPPTRPLPEQAPQQPERGSMRNKIIAGSLAAAAVAGVAAVGILAWNAHKNDNEGSRVAEDKPAATSTALFEYTGVDAVNAYGHKEGIEDFGNRYDLKIDGSNKKEAAEDLIHKLKGNSEQMAHFLTFADYEAAGVPVPEIHDFRGADGNINNRDQLAKEMTTLGAFLHENRKSDAPEHEKVDAAVKWAETQIRENIDKFGVSYVGAQYYDTNFLHHNNAGGFTTAYDDSTLLHVKINGQEFALRADCGWQWWDVAHAPAQQNYAQASFTPEGATSVPVQAAAVAPQGEVQLLTHTIPWGPEVPGVDIPSVDIPPVDIPPTDIPPVDIPPTDIPPVDVPEVLKGAVPAPDGILPLGVQGAPRPQITVPQIERAQPESDTRYEGRTNPVPVDNSSNKPGSETGVRAGGADRSTAPSVDTKSNPGGAGVDTSNSNSSNSAGNGNPSQSTL